MQQNTLGNIAYEITNYPSEDGRSLGNVNVVISDKKLWVASSSAFKAYTLSRTDYFPFGMEISSRTSVGNYRYGYNGMEQDPEAKGEGNSYTTEFRQYDSRIGRWLSLDPLMAQYPMMSPYVAFNNNPIYFVDPLGLEGDPPLGGDNGRNECDDGKSQTDNNNWNSGESAPNNSSPKSQFLTRGDIRDMYNKNPDYQGLSNLEFNRRVGVNFEMAYLSTQGVYSQSTKQFYSKTRSIRTKGKRQYVKPDRVSGTTIVTTELGKGKVGYRYQYFRNTAFTEVKLTNKVALYTSRHQIRGMIAVLSTFRYELQKINKDTRVRAKLTLVVTADTEINQLIQRKCAQSKVDLYVVTPYFNVDGTISFTSPKMLVDGLNLNTVNYTPITDYMNGVERVVLPFSTTTLSDPSFPDVEALEP